jgi:hypothetical protein
MQLEINLSPNITTRPKGNTGEKKVKHLFQKRKRLSYYSFRGST